MGTVPTSAIVSAEGQRAIVNTSELASWIAAGWKEAGAEHAVKPPDLSGLTGAALAELARDKGINGAAKLSRDELLQALAKA